MPLWIPSKTDVILLSHESKLHKMFDMKNERTFSMGLKRHANQNHVEITECSLFTWNTFYL